MFNFKTIGDILQHIEQRYSDQKAFNIFEKRQWRSVSSDSFVTQVKLLTYGLVSLGVCKNDKVGILARSSPEWIIADLAIIMAGGITVPLTDNISEENFVYEVAQTNVRFLFVDGHEQWEAYSTHRNLFKTVISLSELSDVEEAVSFKTILEAGATLMKEKPQLYSELMQQQNEDDVITIIYTSGTMGVPKGAEMTHKNLIHIANQPSFMWKRENEHYLSILPLYHVFSRQINLIMLSWGIKIYYLNNLRALAYVCQTIRPTFMIVVPRVLEVMYEKIKATLLESRIGKWAFKLASNKKPNFFKRWVSIPLANLLVYKKVRQTLGGRFSIILSGGAALDPELCRFLWVLGYPVYEGWGLTEASTPSVNQPGKMKIGTVGTPLPGIKISIGKKGEVVVEGPTVMKGYYRNREATNRAIDEKKRLHTGDKGKIDEEGFLSIKGRLVEYYKLSTGEWLTPLRTEQVLCEFPLIKKAMVVGDKKKYATCLLFPDFDVLRQMKAEHHLPHMSDNEFLHTKIIKREMKSILNVVNNSINQWEKIKDYRFVLDRATTTEEEVELYPTLETRNLILEKYEHLINTMYR